MLLNPFFEFYGKTDPGMERPHNEDTIVLSPEIGLALVADGMGGYSAGEVASSLAGAILKQDIELDFELGHKEWGSTPQSALIDWLSSRIARANQAIINSSKAHPQFAEMGTTLVMGIFQPQWICLAHIGDSRAYLFRDNKLTQLTKDHSWLQEQIDAGLMSEQDAKISNHRHLVTRALGIDEIIQPDVSCMTPQSNDIFLLCSDGLTEMLDDFSITEIMARHSNNLSVLCDELIKEANQMGGWDNISTVAVRVLPPPGRLKRFVFESFLQRWLTPKDKAQ